MFTKLYPIEHIVGKVVPEDIIVVRFKTVEDNNNKRRRSSSGMLKDIKYKATKISVNFHIHYKEGSREKAISTGIQNTYSSEDGSVKEHKLIFIVPGFDVGKFLRASVYLSTENANSVVTVSDIDVVVKKEKDLENEQSLVFVTTWGIKCGIATYSSYLIEALKNIEVLKQQPETNINIVPINDGINVDKIFAKLCHIQHEFGIMPLPPRVHKHSKCIITFHTVMTDMTDDGLGVDSLIGMGMGHEVEMAIGGGGSSGIGSSGIGSSGDCGSGGRGMGMKFTVDRFESSLNVVGYIVHNQESKNVLRKWTDKDIWVVTHGCVQIPDINKIAARNMFELQKIGIKDDDRIGLLFGFQSTGKNYKDLVNVAKKVGIKLVISGARHESVNRDLIDNNITKDSNVIFLNKFLTELEVNLWALGSDILLFSYPNQDHYSVSGAMHRLIGAGRPCIIPDTKHFVDVKEWDDGVLKYVNGDMDSLERKIREGLDNESSSGEGELGNNARNYALTNSWENVAKKHLEIYKKYVDFNLDFILEEML